MLDDGLRVGAEGLDERLAAGERVRASTARQKASPRLGSNREIFGGFTEAGWFSLLAPSIEDSAVSLPPSRYAAEASALVAAVWPPPPGGESVPRA